MRENFRFFPQRIPPSSKRFYLCKQEGQLRANARPSLFHMRFLEAFARFGIDEGYIQLKPQSVCNLL